VTESAPSGPSAGDDERGLGKGARVAILVVVLGGLMVVGLIVSARRRDDFDHTMTRVQVEAKAAGDAIDMAAFRSAWAQQLASGEEQVGSSPAAALVPELPGAHAELYAVTANGVVIDYQIDRGGQQGCVRLVHSVDGTEVHSARHVCAGAFPNTS
jgi:hypothetical protein